jgi:hypothetical protein
MPLSSKDYIPTPENSTSNFPISFKWIPPVRG